MRKEYQIILFLRNLTTGIMAPVLVLILLARGADISSLSLVLGAFSLTVILAEFPSGVMADLYGRKLAFWLGMCLMGASYAILLLADGLATLFPAIVLHGLGRAFASGSIDALALDQAQGDAALIAATARISQLESAGLALGALAGGALAGVGDAYRWNLLLCLGLCLLMVLLTLLTVHETPAAGRPADEPTRQGALRAFARQMGQGLAFLTRRGTVRVLATLGLLTGVALFGVETYWQPALIDLASPPWLLGVVTGAGFAAVMVGTRLSERLLSGKPQLALPILLVGKSLLGLALCALVLPRQAGLFVGVYLVLYSTLGGAGVAESMLLNREAPSSQRAGILSLFSFLTQVGGLLASVLGFVLSQAAGFHAVWLVGGCALVLAGACLACYARRLARRGPTAARTQTPSPADCPRTAAQAEADSAAATLGAALQQTNLADVAFAALSTLAQTTAADAARVNPAEAAAPADGVSPS